MTLFRGVGQLFNVENKQKRSIYDYKKKFWNLSICLRNSRTCWSKIEGRCSYKKRVIVPHNRPRVSNKIGCLKLRRIISSKKLQTQLKLKRWFQVSVSFIIVKKIDKNAVNLHFRKNITISNVKTWLHASKTRVRIKLNTKITLYESVISRMLSVPAAISAILDASEC